MKVWRVSGLGLLLAAEVTLAQQPIPLGAEFQVNTYTTNSQWDPSVALDADGDFVVVWASRGQDGSFEGVFGQRFGADGTPLGGEFQVNTYTSSYQREPAVSAAATGDFVVVWQGGVQDGSMYGVFGQRFGADGTPLGSEFLVNTYTTSSQRAPSVALDADGDFVVVWHGLQQDGSAGGVFGQRFLPDGSALGGEFQVNTYTMDYQSMPSVALGADGDFVVVWASRGQDGSLAGVFGQRFGADGTPLGGEFQVNTYTTDNQWEPSVALDADGDFVVVWDSAGQDGSFEGVFGQRFAADGTPLGGEFQVNTYTINRQFYPSVASDADGDFVVVWQSLQQDGSDLGVFGQSFLRGGTPLGTEFQINTYTTSWQQWPSVALDADGDFVVVWQGYQDGSYFGVFGQRFAGVVIFVDDFESGDTSAWSGVEP